MFGIDESPLPKIIKFDTESFGYFMPNITEKYGKDTKCRLIVNSIETPDINIRRGSINGTAVVDLSNATNLF